MDNEINFGVQENLFGQDISLETDSYYSAKIKAPIYQPKNKKPDILSLFDNSKSKRLVEKIEQSKVSKNEKLFLIAAASRHNIFFYNRVADYYSHSSEEMQGLMEESALVIIDFNDAIKNGFIKFNKEVKELYSREIFRSKREPKPKTETKVSPLLLRKEIERPNLYA